MRAHVIENGIVVNTIEVNSLDFLPNLVDGETQGAIGDRYENGIFTRPPPDLSAAEQSVRAERNERLKQSDWTQLDDTPLDNAAKLAWATYRQALRDVPGQSGFPLDIQWPTQPE